MRILVTGGAGFIGSHFIEHVLQNTDWEVVVLDSLDPNHRGVLERILDSDAYSRRGHRVWIHRHDLRAPISDVLAKRLGPVNYIVNFASQSHVDRSIEEPRAFALNNVELMLTMLDYARTLSLTTLDGLYAFVQISTDEVYGPAPKGIAHREWSPILPSNPYSASKAAQEALCYSYWRTYGLPIILTNTMNNYGQRQDYEKFVPKVIRAVLLGQEVPIHGAFSSVGAKSKYFVPGSRFYLHARNHADAVLWLLQHERPFAWGEGGSDEPLDRYNVVGDREVDNLELAELIAKIVGKPLHWQPTDFHSSRPGHDLRYALDGAKIAEAGWKAPVSFEDSLVHTVRWSIDHKEWLGL